jgi:hypothetical protein
MRKITAMILTLVAAFLHLTLWEGGLFMPEAGLAQQEDPALCKKCHADLAQKVPQGQPALSRGVVHFSHYSNPKFTGGCRSCHPMDPAGNFELTRAQDGKKINIPKESLDKLGAFYRSWGTSSFEDHKHALKKVDCLGCHGEPFPTNDVPMANCLKCHGSFEKLAQKAPIHGPTHRGPLECRECHKAHAKSVSMCTQCH